MTIDIKRLNRINRWIDSDYLVTGDQEAIIIIISGLCLWIIGEKFGRGEGEVPQSHGK